jgi:hypothetical protein
MHVESKYLPCPRLVQPFKIHRRISRVSTLSRSQFLIHCHFKNDLAYLDFAAALKDVTALLSGAAIAVDEDLGSNFRNTF